MLHHVSVGVSDVERAAKFYDAVLKALGYKRVVEYLPYAVGYGERGGSPQFWIGRPHNQQIPTSGNGTHVGFSASSKGQVNKFHEAALAQGGSNNGEPGPRPDYGPAYYGAFIYDLDGNKIEATVHRSRETGGGQAGKEEENRLAEPAARDRHREGQEKGEEESHRR